MIRYSLLVSLAAAAALAAPPEQAARGEALFHGDAKCGTCHALKGKGTAIGPDLKVIARLSPQAIVMAIRSTRTQYVQAVKPKKGEEFPAMVVSKDDKAVKLFDLSVMPPAEKTMEPAEISGMRDNDKWKHPPSTGGLTAEQMADVIAYVRYAATGDTKGVDPATVQ